MLHLCHGLTWFGQPRQIHGTSRVTMEHVCLITGKELVSSLKASEGFPDPSVSRSGVHFFKFKRFFRVMAAHRPREERNVDNDGPIQLVSIGHATHIQHKHEHQPKHSLVAPWFHPRPLASPAVIHIAG